MGAHSTRPKVRAEKRLVARLENEVNAAFNRRTRHTRFVEAYNANECNRLPGPVLHYIYKNFKTQREVQAQAKLWRERQKARHEA